MRIKQASHPGQFVYPEAQCTVNNTKEKKLAKHVILQHGNTIYAQKAQGDIQRIKVEKQEKNKD